MKRSISKFIFILLLTVSCELVVDVDMPIETPGLTLNSYFTPDSVWNAYVTLSRHILDNAGYYDSVTNANVAVYQDGIPVETLVHMGYGHYKSAQGKPIPGVSYEMRAEVPGYETVKAASAAPALTEIQAPEFNIPQDHDQEITVSFKLTDNPDEANYYEVRLIVERTERWWHYGNGSGDTTEQTFISEAYIESDDPAVSNDNDLYYGSLIFKDVLFNGKEFTVQFKSRAYRMNSFYGTSEVNKYFISLRTLSEDYYLYRTTSELQDYTSGDPFAQPVTVYNNIANGYGIFAGYSEDTVEYTP